MLAVLCCRGCQQTTDGVIDTQAQLNYRFRRSKSIRANSGMVLFTQLSVVVIYTRQL